MQRYYVDVRDGCGAVRDRQKTGNEEQGLNPHTKGVVLYKIGKWSNIFGEWVMDKGDLQELKDLVMS